MKNPPNYLAAVALTWAALLTPLAGQGAEPFEIWQQTHPAAAFGSFGTVVETANDADGNLYVAGRGNLGTTAAPDYAYAVVKYSPDGTQIWTATYSPAGTQTDDLDRPCDIVTDDAGNVYVCGRLGNQCITVKWDSSGDLQWATPFTSPATGRCLAVDDDGNVYVAADARSIYTIKYSNGGVQQWVQNYAPSAGGIPWAIAVDGSGNPIVAGRATLGSGFNQQDDFFTVKYNSAGVQQWLKTRNFLYNAARDEARCLAIGSDDAVYVAGTGGNGANAIVKYDAAGTELWAKTKYVSSASNTDETRKVVLDGSGNAYCFGQIGIALGAIKYDAAGTEIWTRRYIRRSGGFGGASGGAVDAAGNVFVAGDSSLGEFDFDATLVCYAADGTFQWAKLWKPAGVTTDHSSTFLDVFLDADGGIYLGGGFISDTANQLLAVKYGPPPPPTVVTAEADQVTATGALLHGTINPRGSAATVYFEYGTTESYGAQTPNQAIPAGGAVLPIQAELAGLVPEMTYHFRLVAVGVETVEGEDFTFTTPVAPPAITGTATNLTGVSALLRGQGTPGASGSVTVRFEYGLTTAYGRVTPSVTLTGPSGLPLAVSAQLTDLERGAEFHFRLVEVGGSAGVDRTFSTLVNTAPVATPDRVVIRGPGKVTLALLDNDTDAEGDHLVVDAVGAASAGKAELKEGAVTYTPGRGFPGEDTFTYTVYDLQGGRSTGVVTVINPFFFTAGAYAATLLDATSLKPGSTIKAKVTAGGAISGSVALEGKSYGFKGTINDAGLLVVSIPRRGLPALVVKVEVSIASLENGDFGLATFTVTDGGSTQIGIGTESATVAPPSVTVGNYTLALPTEDQAGIAGTGYATVSVSKTGAAKFAGRLPDGTPWSAGVQVQVDGTASLFIPLYGKPKGYAAGDLVFRDAETVDGPLTVHKPAQEKPGKQLYPAGFDLELLAEGERFADPGKGSSALHGESSAVSYRFTAVLDDELETFEAEVDIDAADKLRAGLKPQRLDLKFNRKTGFVSGSFLDPDTAAKRVLNGVILQTSQVAKGLFLDAAEARRFSLEQP
jgi:hypothetical protein